MFKLPQTKLFMNRDEFMRHGHQTIEFAAMKARAAGVSAKRVVKAVAGASMALAAEAALAVPPDFSDLTDAVDFSTAITAVLAIFAALAGFAIVWKGGKKILAALGWR